MTARKRTFLDPKKIDAAITEIAKLAAEHGQRVALAGGCALQLYGSDRFTADVDVVASGPITAKQGKALTFGGYRTRAKSVTVDVILRADVYEALYDVALRSAHRIAGSAVPVVRLEHLGAMKMAAGRAKDVQDLYFILTDTDVNYVLLRKIVGKHLGPYAAEELDSLLQIAKLEKKVRS